MKISWLDTVAGVAVVGTVVRAVYFTPLEARQGAAQKIFYIHVPSAWVAFFAFGLVAVASAVFRASIGSRKAPPRWALCSRPSC
jgi:ABC-type transport system involved in cytochrome c biogenesis permease subunit